ncbi:hypothetical protein [Gemmata sp.]|uniref:hypothetical protein n=1 Tax=Gemmata sp. TaxID=1914242 RepID=UPI003F6E92EE
MRVLVTSADGAALARFGAAVLGCETAAHPCDCLGRLRAEPPDVLVLLAPVPWPAAAAVLAAVATEPALRHVPAVLLPGTGPDRAMEALRGWLGGAAAGPVHRPAPAGPAAATDDPAAEPAGPTPAECFAGILRP